MRQAPLLPSHLSSPQGGPCRSTLLEAPPPERHKVMRVVMTAWLLGRMQTRSGQRHYLIIIIIVLQESTVCMGVCGATLSTLVEEPVISS